MKTIREYFHYLLNNFHSKLSKGDVYELLGQLLSRSYAEMVINMDYKLTESEQEKLDQAIELLKTDYPLAYITYRKYFYHNFFYVNNDVLIPRTETEGMVNEALSFIKINYPAQSLVYYDICTGSGAIGLSVKQIYPNMQAYLSDISIKALHVAQRNSVSLNLHNINFINGDFLQPFLKNRKIPRANLIIINPPYLDVNDPEVEMSVRKYEPEIALFAQDNGLFFYHLVANSYQKLVDKKHKFLIIMEFGYQQKEQIEDIFRPKLDNDTKISFTKDLDGH